MSTIISTAKSLAYFLMSKGRYTEAFELSVEAARLDQDDSEITLIVGLCLYNLGINDMAYMWLKKSLGDIDKAHMLYEKHLWKNAQGSLGKITYGCKRDYEEASRHLPKAIGITESIDNEINLMLGIIANARGDYSESTRLLILPKEHTGLEKDSLFSSAISSFMLEDLTNAKKYISNFLEFHKDYLPAQFLLDNISDEEQGKLFRDFIMSDNNNTDFSNKIGSNLRAYSDEITEIYQHRDQCWHTACLFNDLDGLVLYSLIREMKPRNVIEFSPYMGYSTIFLYKALMRNRRDLGGDFRLETFDIEDRSEFRENMRLFDIPLSVSAGDALKTVPDYIKTNGLEGNIDLCFIDSDHSYQFAKNYIENIFPLLGRDCIIAIHDMYCCPDKVDIPFDHYSPINGKDICETITSIGEARAVREFFKDRDDYVLISTHKLFGGMAQCAPPMPLNVRILKEINLQNPFLNPSGNYWALAPMLILAIPIHIWQHRELIFKT